VYAEISELDLGSTIWWQRWWFMVMERGLLDEE
jgi:hypothetical protein